MKKINTTLLTLLVLGLASTANAQSTYTWTGNGAGQLIKTQGNWDSPAWGNGDTALIDTNNNGTTIYLNINAFKTSNANNVTGITTVAPMIFQNTGGATLSNIDTNLVIQGYTVEMSSGILNLGTTGVLNPHNTGTGSYIQSGTAALTAGAINVGNNASFQMLGGTATLAGNFDIGNSTALIGGNSLMNLTTGALDLGNGNLNILADATGGITAGSQLWGGGNVNFADGVSSSFGLTIAGYGSSFETEWNQGDLTFGSFDQSNSSFATHFNVVGDTLRVVPESSTYALIAGMLALTSVMIRRRR
jgi:hypothetical protein